MGIFHEFSPSSKSYNLKNSYEMSDACVAQLVWAVDWQLQDPGSNNNNLFITNYFISNYYILLLFYPLNTFDARE